MLGDVYPIGGAGAPATGQQDYPIIVSTTQPTGPYRGMAWGNPTNNVLKIYDGANWVIFSSSSSLPAGTKQGQVLQTGAGPTFSWIADEHIDSGRY